MSRVLRRFTVRLYGGWHDSVINLFNAEGSEYVRTALNNLARLGLQSENTNINLQLKEISNKNSQYKGNKAISKTVVILDVHLKQMIDSIPHGYKGSYFLYLVSKGESMLEADPDALNNNFVLSASKGDQGFIEAEAIVLKGGVDEREDVELGVDESDDTESDETRDLYPLPDEVKEDLYEENEDDENSLYAELIRERDERNAMSDESDS